MSNNAESQFGIWHISFNGFVSFYPVFGEVKIHYYLGVKEYYRCVLNKDGCITFINHEKHECVFTIEDAHKRLKEVRSLNKNYASLS